MNHDRDADVNPYQSPTSSDLDADPEELLKSYPGGAIEVSGSLPLNAVFLVHLDRRCGYTEFAILTWLATVFMLAWGAMIAAVLTSVASRSGIVWAILAGIETFVVLVLVWIRVRWTTARHLKRLWDERSGIFADQMRRITSHGIQIRSAQGQIETPWSDYASYGLFGDGLMLHLRSSALHRRRQAQVAAWKAGRRWLDTTDIFPREQFHGKAEWTLFVRLVKQKLGKR